MTAYRNPMHSDEAHWIGVERCWASIEQYPPRKERSSWWLVAGAVVLVAVTLSWLR